MYILNPELKYIAIYLKYGMEKSHTIFAWYIYV